MISFFILFNIVNVSEGQSLHFSLPTRRASILSKRSLSISSFFFSSIIVSSLPRNNGKAEVKQAWVPLLFFSPDTPYFLYKEMHCEPFTNSYNRTYPDAWRANFNLLVVVCPHPQFHYCFLLGFSFSWSFFC